MKRTTALPLILFRLLAPATSLDSLSQQGHYIVGGGGIIINKSEWPGSVALSVIHKSSFVLFLLLLLVFHLFYQFQLSPYFCICWCRTGRQPLSGDWNDKSPLEVVVDCCCTSYSWNYILTHSTQQPPSPHKRMVPPSFIIPQTMAHSLDSTTNTSFTSCSSPHHPLNFLNSRPRHSHDKIRLSCATFSKLCEPQIAAKQDLRRSSADPFTAPPCHFVPIRIFQRGELLQ